MAATILARCRSNSSALSAPRGSSPVSVTAPGHVDGGEVVQHVEAGHPDVTAHLVRRGRPRVGPADDRGIGGRLEPLDVEAVAQHADDVGDGVAESDHLTVDVGERHLAGFCTELPSSIISRRAIVGACSAASSAVPSFVGWNSRPSAETTSSPNRARVKDSVAVTGSRDRHQHALQPLPGVPARRQRERSSAPERRRRRSRRWRSPTVIWVRPKYSATVPDTRTTSPVDEGRGGGVEDEDAVRGGGVTVRTPAGRRRRAGPAPGSRRRRRPRP